MPFVYPEGKLPGTTDTLKAKALLAHGDRLARAGEEQRAIGAYWFLMRDYPRTLAGKEAWGRLEALGMRRMGDGSCVVDPRLRGKRRK
jgi:hypothetical protein